MSYLEQYILDFIFSGFVMYVILRVGMWLWDTFLPDKPVKQVPYTPKEKQ